MDRTERRYFQAWAISATFFRLPLAMAPLSLILSLSSTSGYSHAALGVSSLTLGEVLSLGVSGFRSRRGRRSTLSSATLRLFLLAAAVLALFTSIGASFILVLLAALGFGCMASLTFGLQRAELTAGLHSHSIERALALDSVLLEIAWILGPLLASILGLSLGPLVGMWSLPAFTAGGLGLRLFTIPAPRSKPSGSSTPERHGGRRGLWGRAGLEIWIASAVEGLLEGGVVVGAVLLASRAGAGALLAGPLLTVLSLGAIAGGLVYAHNVGDLRAINSSRTLRWLLLALSSLTALISLSDSLPRLFLSVFLLGIFVSPTNSVRSFMVVTTFDPQLRSQGFAVLYGMYSIGSALAALCLAIGVHHLHLRAIYILMALAGGATVGALRLMSSSRY